MFLEPCCPKGILRKKNEFTNDLNKIDKKQICHLPKIPDTNMLVDKITLTIWAAISFGISISLKFFSVHFEMTCCEEIPKHSDCYLTIVNKVEQLTRPKNIENPSTKMFLVLFKLTNCKLDNPTAVIILNMTQKSPPIIG